MTKLKQRILASLVNGAQLENTINDLSTYQEKLLKNHSNDMINSSNKNRMLKAYSEIDSIRKSLTRYNNLNQENYINEAENEQKEIEHTVLKSGISNYKYIWRSEKGEHTCDKCKSLDGTIYELWDEVPQRPHPNCKCKIEVLEIPEEDIQNSNDIYNQETNSYKNKINDLLKQINDLEIEITKIINSLLLIFKEVKEWLIVINEIKEILIHLPIHINQINKIQTNCNKAEESVKIIIKDIEYAQKVYEIFLLHKKEMENDTRNIDKYYHAKANCESATLGKIEEKWALLFSIAKEIDDFRRKVFILHWDTNKVLQDCYEDLQADFYGLQQGKNPGQCSDKVKNAPDIFK